MGTVQLETGEIRVGVLGLVNSLNKVALPMERRLETCSDELIVRRFPVLTWAVGHLNH